MWIFLRDGFFSVVQDRNNARLLLVRARQREHLQRHFPDHEIHETPERDYRFRLTAERDVVSQWLARVSSEIAYPNFKDNIPDPQYRFAATTVWQEMLKIQE